MSFWQVIKEWQPLITGVLTGTIGFGGVIFTLWMNARNQERLEAARRKADASALRAGLVGELAMMQREAEMHSGFIKDAAEDTEHLLPFTGPTAVFDAAVPRLGLLTLREIAVVMRAYQSRIETRHLTLLAAEEGADKGHASDSSPGWRWVRLRPGGAVRLLSRLHRDTKAAEAAIETISEVDPSLAKSFGTAANR